MKKAILPLLFIFIAILWPVSKEAPKQSEARIQAQLNQPNFSEEDLFSIRRLRLYIAPEDYEFFFSKKPLSLSSFQKAKVLTDENPALRNVQVRIRGQHAWHWYPEKPSLRIHSSNKNRIWGRTELNLVNPEDPTMLANILGDWLAIKIGLAASMTRFCQVWINDRYAGLYHLTDQLDENLLAKLGIPDSPLIEGNSWKLAMWRNIDLWDVISKDLQKQNETRQRFEKLLSIIAPPVSSDNLKEVDSYLSFEGLASWSAFLTLIGSLHMDDFHNQHFIFRDQKKIFIPAINDPSGFGSLTNIGLKFEKEDFEIPLYEYLTPITNAAFRSPYFQFHRNKCLWNLVQGLCKTSYLKNLASRLFEKIRPMLEVEKNKGALINIPKIVFPMRLPISVTTQASSVISLKYWIERRNEFIQRCLSTTGVRIYPFDSTSPAQAPEYKLFVLEIKGHSPIEWDLGSMASSVKLDIDRNKNILPDDPTAPPIFRIYPGISEFQASEIRWLRIQSRLFNYTLEPASQTYLIGIMATEENKLLSVLKNGKNSITGETCAVTLDSKIFYPASLYSLASCLHAWDFSTDQLNRLKAEGFLE